MSMNLHCRSGGVDVELQQTPTQITNMCLVQLNGKVDWNVTGNKAKHALQIYCQWLEGSLNRVYPSVEYAVNSKNWIFSNIKEIQKVIKSKKKLEVYKM